MTQTEIILLCIELVLGGIASFCSIILWAKKRSAGVICISSFVISSYSATVYSMLCRLGIVEPERIAGGISLFGIPILTLLFTTLPAVLLILALILFIVGKTR